MITSLYIQNYTLIDRLQLQMHSGFSVITGETGAGKSIILGAIGLLLGNRADARTVKQGTDKCTIEAHFDLSRYNMRTFFTDNDIDYDDADCILRRELTASGKSRAFINDTPVSLTLMRELGQQLVDIHSQHQNLMLQKEDFQLNVLDIIAACHEQVLHYRQAYNNWLQAERQLRQLRADIEQSRKNEDFLRFQYNELHDASLHEGEQAELEQQADLLTHAEDIKQALYNADRLLSDEDGGAVTQLRQTVAALSSITAVYPQMQSLAERIESTYIEINDVAADVSNHLERTDFDPSQLDAVNQRLDRLYTLQQKYHVDSEAALLALEQQLAQQIGTIDNSDEQLHELEQQVGQLLANATKEATKLTVIRNKAARAVEKQLTERLVPLGIPNVRFSVSLQPKPLAADGADKVSFLFSANTSTPMQPIAQVASGGEIARVMLSLKAMISSAVRLPTIIFDEIDTGVSGKIASLMAAMMQEMGQAERQVISITHLPQIAACGTHHYKVTKTETSDGTQTHMAQLSPEQREVEIAQMLSGDTITPAALQNARELLSQN